ncbi:hypothetical protein [Flagellimonas halotolerans]|uniref:Pectate lyase domain-containing protein n=1 Tax=Flagellimonas halotolerans TaxID=3112164 RepID=A0ABU6ISB3_9FLAO|nr:MULTISPECIES: hypothetical protein [unclassified Allomuricauda]MEC3966160.1 hypothetical protein [Muricauda sp. SYSU M86414]MEC4266025.1 hypothetical protein [Muricauda sp. SYSU M84420]
MKRIHVLMLFIAFILFWNIACSPDQELFDLVQEENQEENGDGQNNGGGDVENPTDEGSLPDNVSDTSELKAFPSAYGAGAYATGGRGGKVIKVTNLNGSGSGSFREAMLESGARTIVFDVSGTIDLGGNDIYLSGATKGNLTVAGQTAPRGGVTFTNGTIYFEAVDNVVIRYLRGRPAQAASGEVSQGDAFIFWGCNDVILDHVSVSFGGDQAITFNSGTKTMNRITIQKSLISDSYTGIIMGANNPDRYPDVDGVSFLNNLVVDMPHRTPNFSGDGYFESVNNVIYNWMNRAINVNGGYAKVNHINNYYKRGRITERNTIEYNSNKIQIPNSSTNPSVYTAGNYYYPVLVDPNADNTAIWTDFSSSAKLPNQYFVSNQYPLLGAKVQIQDAVDAYESTMENVGANRFISDSFEPQFYLDPYDSGKVNNVLNDVSTTPKDYSNWIVPNIPINYRADNFDSDGDGMPNQWEVTKNLDPNNPADGNEDFNNDGYTNLEDYLNLVDF